MPPSESQVQTSQRPRARDSWLPYFIPPTTPHTIKYKTRFGTSSNLVGICKLLIIAAQNDLKIDA